MRAPRDGGAATADVRPADLVERYRCKARCPEDDDAAEDVTMFDDIA